MRGDAKTRGAAVPTVIGSPCETCHSNAVTRMTVRDVRLKWPEAERLLATAGEIVVTRDSKPVARIIPYHESGAGRRRRFDPVAHARWLRRFWKGKSARPTTDELLRRDRGD